jgi:hypothetical protein
MRGVSGLSHLHIVNHNGVKPGIRMNCSQGNYTKGSMYVISNRLNN